MPGKYLMKNASSTGQPISLVRTYVIWGAILWTVIIAASLAWNIHYRGLQTLARAGIIAQLFFDQNITLYSWLTHQGGVYVPLTPTTPSNPYLDLPDKDAATGRGKSLTLLNPEYVMRQLYELLEKKSGVHGHFTSLRPLRPANKPDPWEEQALKTFEAGRKEAIVVQTMDGTEYVRLIKPLVIEAKCLECHAAQRYQKGDIRGGLSVAVPLAPLRALQRSSVVMMMQVHALFWILGLAGIFIFRARVLKSERSRLQLEDLYRTLTESSHAGIYIVLDGKFCFSNSKMAAYAGYSVAEMIGIDTSVIVHPEDMAAVKQNALAMLKKQRHDPYEFRIISKDGDIRWVMETVTSIQYRGRRALLGNCMDVTSRKLTEESLQRTTQQLQETGNMLIQAEKAAMAGKLAAGVAHEILNPVNILSMRLQFLDQMEKLSDTGQDTLSICKNQIDRIVKIVHDLDQLTQTTTSLKAPCDLNGMIRQFLASFAGRLNGESIAIDLHLEEGLPILTLNQERLDQVLQILMNNALDALAGKENKLAIITTRVLLNQQGSSVIRISISDRGHGIKEENLKRIFDPFFTTREPGKGTGIGLSIAYRIIEEQGGVIWAENNEWGGAVFHIELPIVV
jgi:chemotaxis family two-component system sensor kinase Cph1